MTYNISKYVVYKYIYIYTLHIYIYIHINILYIYTYLRENICILERCPRTMAHGGSSPDPGARTKQYMSDPEYKKTCFLYLPAIVSAAISGPPEGGAMMWHV